MHNLNYLPLLLSMFHFASTLTFSEPSTLLSDATQTPLSNPTASAISAVQCLLPDIPAPLDEGDCLGALGLLPNVAIHTRFHRGTGEQYYKLPLSVSQGHCRIQIDLIDDTTEEESSWDEVYDGANSLVVECVEDLGGLGGRILVGDHLKIRVTISYIVDEAPRRNNSSTILSSRTPSLFPLSASVPYCYPPDTSTAPEPLDCLVIQERLPNFPVGRTFHRAGAIDGYHLPVTVHYQTCEVSITLVDHVLEEESSWKLVAAGAALLIARCVLEEAHPRGEILVGERDHIRVIVRYFVLEAWGDSNSTILSGRVP